MSLMILLFCTLNDVCYVIIFVNSLDTSRAMRSYEADGRDYFFVSRQTMENFIQKRKFIEFGEYKGSLYGTSKDSIKRAMKSGKTCVLKVQPEVSQSSYLI